MKKVYIGMSADLLLDIGNLAKSAGNKWVERVVTENEIENKLEILAKIEGPALLEIRIRKGFRKNLGLPTTTPKENKANLLKFIAQ